MDMELGCAAAGREIWTPVIEWSSLRNPGGETSWLVAEELLVAGLTIAVAKLTKPIIGSV